MVNNVLNRAGQQRLARFVCASLFVVLLAGCAADIFSSDEDVADRIARSFGWQKHTFNTDTFAIRGYLRRVKDSQRPLTVYLEGDGDAWINEHQLAVDPTPSKPLVLKLAVRHPGGNVLYLARPCHYIQTARCHPQFWSTHRFAPEIISSTNQAIQRVKEKAGARSVRLVGWSGGGVIAALLALRRNDVEEIITLGANLDHAYWTRMDRLTPLYGSLNPADYAKTLQNISQRHFIGANDVVVSPRVVKSYINKMSDTSKTKFTILENFDHDCCWVEHWPQLLNRF
jgi:pyrimidine operon attenuation protein/uracil phosphoribosyltransferase